MFLKFSNHVTSTSDGVYWSLNAGLCPLCVVYNLTNNIDVENTKLRMEQYQRENRDIIQKNKAKLVCTKCIFPHMQNAFINGDKLVLHCTESCEVSTCNIPFLCFPAPQTREQEELEELLLLEQQGNEQRRLEVLQEEKRQLQAKRKNKQALLDELVSFTHVACVFVST